ncbi:MAG: CoA ester lyase [Deltaproteobacteria bacterium]|jgi:citrate lyase subunit beta/citryl-CoA lyase|nr:CoA ester lyase [Deltaproteobacteria bacterium]
MRRSLLFMPGINPGNILNADVFGADSIILDLEDAIAYAEKDSARILTRNALQTFDFSGTEVIVRINSLSTPFWDKDLDMIIPQRPDAIMPTKIHGPRDIQRISEYMEKLERAHGLEIGAVRLIPLLESAASIENAPGIATASPRMAALYLGAEDLALDMRATRTAEGTEILYARSRLVMAARAAGIDALDTPFIRDIHDLDALRADCLLAKNLGFNGKASIYPGHVEIINAAFSPTRDQYMDALDLLAEVEKAANAGKGVSTFRGKLVDGPVIIIAEQTVREYEAMHRGMK